MQADGPQRGTSSVNPPVAPAGVFDLWGIVSGSKRQSGGATRGELTVSSPCAGVWQMLRVQRG